MRDHVRATAGIGPKTAEERYNTDTVLGAVDDLTVLFVKANPAWGGDEVRAPAAGWREPSQF